MKESYSAYISLAEDTQKAASGENELGNVGSNFHPISLRRLLQRSRHRTPELRNLSVAPCCGARISVSVTAL